MSTKKGRPGTSGPAKTQPGGGVERILHEATDIGTHCLWAYSVRGLEPLAPYVLYVYGSDSVSTLFTTNAGGAYKQAGTISVNRAAFNKTNTITTTLYPAGGDQIETKVHIADRCPAS